MTAVSTQLPWYVARSAGLVAWVLLTASVLWGLTMTTQLVRGRVGRPWLLDLHRYLGGLAAIFTGVHVGALLADTYVHFSLTSVLVPFASSWRTSAVAWGIVAGYLLVAVELTSLARQHLSRRVWHAIHLSSFPLFFMATIHMLTAGTDTRNHLVQGTAFAAIGAVTVLTARRVVRDTKPRRAVPLTTR
ncbi:MAG: putative rane protein [Actinomycetia bacterium]|jgi:sulfoxide reductase heme-binding subunit YedZ|nr:putative rane protein [Actinomycetes bacterium]